MAALRIIFMGTPDLAAASLRALLRVPKFQIVAVVTQPDRPKGRDLKLQPSPVKQLAFEAGLSVLQPEKARDEKFIAELRVLQPEVIAVAAFDFGFAALWLPECPHVVVAKISRRIADPIRHPQRR